MLLFLLLPVRALKSLQRALNPAVACCLMLLPDSHAARFVSRLPVDLFLPVGLIVDVVLALGSADRPLQRRSERYLPVSDVWMCWKVHAVRERKGD